jgi:hypothetical protein
MARVKAEIPEAFKRFALAAGPVPGMVMAREGGWVRHSDHLAKVEEAQAMEKAAVIALEGVAIERDERLAQATAAEARAAHTEQLLAEAREEFEKRAESKDMMHAARAGESDKAAVCQGKAEAFREAARFLAPQGGEEERNA